MAHAEAAGARMPHDFGVPKDLLHHYRHVFEQLWLGAVVCDNKSIEQVGFGNTVVWSHIGHYDFNEISIGIGIQGVGGAGKKEGNVPSNGKTKWRFVKILLWQLSHCNKSSNDSTDAKDIEANNFRMTKDQYRQNILRLRALRHDIHIRHINNLEMLAKDRQEYWRRPLFGVRPFMHWFVRFSCHDFLIALMVRLDDPVTRAKFGLVYFFHCGAFACAGVGMYIAVKSSRYQRDNGNEGHQNRSDAYVVCPPKGSPKSTGKIPFLQRQQDSNCLLGSYLLDQTKQKMLRTRRIYWRIEMIIQYGQHSGLLSTSLHGFIVHEHKQQYCDFHCTCLSAMVIPFPTLIYLLVEFGLARCLAATFVPIWICLLGFLCAPCSRWVLNRKKPICCFY